MKARITALLMVAALAGLAPAVAAVDDEEYAARRGVSDRFQFNLATWVKSFDSGVQLDSDTAPGTGIDIEELLGLEKDRTDLRLDAVFRFARKHRLEFGYSFWKRDSTLMISDEIEYGDTVFDVDAVVTSEFDTQIIKTVYKYSFVNNGKVDAGISAGLSTFIVEVSLAGDATVGGTQVTGAVEAEDAIAPVPMLGGHVDVTLRPGLFFRASGELFDLSASDIAAKVSDVKATFDWYPWKHVGLGVGYNRISIDYDDEAVPAFLLDYDFEGVLAYLSFIFGGK